ncbi:MAG: GAF domain-containing protein [Burkholderiaceae bacterium]
MSYRLDTIRECFEGVIPAIIATIDPQGIPNVALLSQVHFIDAGRIALSYQFFNKTRQNILQNPRATLLVTNPLTAAQYRLSLHFSHTETTGQIFEEMKAKLAGIASHTGMSGVFRLLGSDVFEVLAIEAVAGTPLPAKPPRNLLAMLRLCARRLAGCRDLEHLLGETLACLHEHLDIDHAMLLMADAANGRLYAVASHGYEESGVGSEIPFGSGVIGVAARERTPIRIGHMNSEYAYGRAVKQNTVLGAGVPEPEIPMPGLAESRSQCAVPIIAYQKLLGVLYVESPHDLRFSYDDEDALVTLCAQVGLAIDALQSAAEEAEDSAAQKGAVSSAPQGPPMVVRHFPGNDSIFIGDEYLIKGVAGSIFWVLLCDYAEKGRVAYSNRELRLDPRIRLPDISDNLEARLILLARRLSERGHGVRIEKTGRGRFQLNVTRPLQLVDMGA